MSGCNDVVSCATPVMVWCTKAAVMRANVSSHSRTHPSPGLGVPSGLGRMVVGVILLLLVLSGDVETNPGPVGEFLVYCSVVYTKAPSKKVICDRGHTSLSDVSFPDPRS